jgi:UDP-glucose:tetrahydrobiopterin glucosyltransferase
VEAMACGVPVVAYRRGGPGELVQPGLNGLLVEPDDVDALAAAAQQVGAIDRRGCRRWVEQQASRQAFAARLEAWLEAGLARGPGR